MAALAIVGVAWALSPTYIAPPLGRAPLVTQYRAPLAVAFRPRAPAKLQATEIPADDKVEPDDENPLELNFASYKTGGRKLSSKVFSAPGVRSLYLFGSSLRDSSRRSVNLVKRAASSIPAYQQLLILNILVFALQKTLLPTLIMSCSRINSLILRRNQVHRLFTPMFLHADFRHLLFNSLSLANIGGNVEVLFGTKRFLLVYLASGIVGNLAGLEYGGNTPSVGASGCVFGLLGALLVWVRRSQELRTEVSSSFVQSIFLTCVFGLLPRRGVDQWAHVGGLVGGLLVSAIFAPWRWGTQRAKVSGRGYIIQPASSSGAPLVPEGVVNVALVLLGGAVFAACAYGADYAQALQRAQRWGLSGTAIRRLIEQPPRRPGLWRFF